VTIVPEPLSSMAPADRPFSAVSRKSFAPALPATMAPATLPSQAHAGMRRLPSTEAVSVAHEESHKFPRQGSVSHLQVARPRSISAGSAPGNAMRSTMGVPTRTSTASHTVLACGLCGCDEFKENAFKPGHCAACFHKH
jgi:hypothetical protein